MFRRKLSFLRFLLVINFSTLSVEPLEEFDTDDEPSSDDVRSSSSEDLRENVAVASIGDTTYFNAKAKKISLREISPIAWPYARGRGIWPPSPKKFFWGK